jgi:predicted dehydrogenase
MAIHWGILGTGHIASLFADDLRLLPDAVLVAVGSRAQARADAFGDRFDVPHRHASYEGVVANADVDVVYVATPHVVHAEQATMALEAGKAVLCEKPLTLNATEARALMDTARANDAFLMEALWTRFLPVMQDVRRCIDDGEIGPVQIVRADIGAVRALDPAHRLFNPDLGGGALLDLGIYPLALAQDLLGDPEAQMARAVRGETGVDVQCAGVLSYASGAQAVWHASLRGNTGRTCAIAGPKGRLEGANAWWKGAPFMLTRRDGSTQTFARPYEGNGYQFEAAHVMNCLRAGRAESPCMPLADSLSLLQQMDAMRADWGLVYPAEQAG